MNVNIDPARDHSPSEVREAVKNLTDEDFKRLMAFALGYCSRRACGAAISPDDLLQKAITRTLSPGERNWKKGVPFLQHIDQAMRSDSSHAAETLSNHPVSELPTGKEEELAESSVSTIRQLELRDELGCALQMFEKNPLARNIIILKADDLSASAIQKALGISQTDYDTALRWTRRRRAEYLKQGDI